MTAWLVDTLLATSALMRWCCIVREPVRRQFGAPAAYALWLIPAARMLMPPMTRRSSGSSLPATAAELAPMTLASLAPCRKRPPMRDVSLVEQLGGWPKILVAFDVDHRRGAYSSASASPVYRRQRRAALDGAVQLARLGSSGSSAAMRCAARSRSACSTG